MRSPIAISQQRLTERLLRASEPWAEGWSAATSDQVGAQPAWRRGALRL